MKPNLHGEIPGPAVAVIGVWDPISAVQRQLFDRLSAYAQRNGLASLAIAIEPHPAAYRPGESEFPVYSDLPTRIRLILASGVEGVLSLHFTPRDVYAGVKELFAAIAPIVDVSELWLGATQTLGRLEAGDSAAIDPIAKEHAIKITRLGDRPRPTRKVRQLLQAGQIREASRLVGQPPFRRRPRYGKLKFGWCPGRYEAVPVADPTSSFGDASLMLELSSKPRGSPRLTWPDPAIEYLAFVSGPGDEPERDPVKAPA
jgi:FAD synthase